MARKRKRLLIHGGRVVDPGSGIDALRDVLISRGKIAAVERGLAKGPLARSRDVRLLDAKGCWVLPGIIDMHVHLREPGHTDAETIATGTRAAAHGGVATVVAMANTLPAIDSPETLKSVRALARGRAVINVLFAAAVTRGLHGKELTQMRRLADSGAAAFSDDGRPVMNAELMRRALEHSRELGLPVLDHAEDDNLTGHGVVHAGAAAKRRRLPGIPSSSETVMAARDIELAERTGGALHICHVSCAGTVELVRRAKQRGLKVTAEAAPHHFTLTDSDIRGSDANYKMKPPLRGFADVRAILEGLADGTIDAIATDHAPHTAARKSRGLREAPFGIIGLETLVPLALRLVERGVLSRLRMAERLAAGPARILGLRGKGSLRRGADGDVTVIDPKPRWTVNSRFSSKSRNTPFIGRRLRGWARATVVGGRIAFQRLEDDE